MARATVLNHYPVLTLFVFLAGCAVPNACRGPNSAATVADPRPATSRNIAELRSPSASAVSQTAYEIPADIVPERQSAPDGLAPRPERVLPGADATCSSNRRELRTGSCVSRHWLYGSDDPADPFSGQAELSVEQLVAEVQARNPSLQAASAAWRAAAERYPQVVSFDDPMFTGMIGPKGIGMEDGGGWMVASLAKVPWAANGPCAAAWQRPRPKPCAEILAIPGCGWPKRPGRHFMTIIWPAGRWR